MKLLYKKTLLFLSLDDPHLIMYVCMLCMTVITVTTKVPL